MSLNTNPTAAYLGFLEHLEVERNVSQLTIRNYGHYLSRFNDWFASQGLTDLKQLDMDVLRSYRLYLAHFQDQHGDSLSKKTQSYHVIALRSWFKWLVKNDQPVLNPEKID
jgi:site-specific recombinase XerD